MPSKPVPTSAHVDGSGMIGANAAPPLRSAAGPVPYQICAPVASAPLGVPGTRNRSSMSMLVLAGKSVSAGNLQLGLLAISTLQTAIWVAAPTVEALNATMKICVCENAPAAAVVDGVPNPAPNPPS